MPALTVPRLFESDVADPHLFEVQTRAEGPVGSIPLTDERLRTWPSGDLFGLTQNAGMGWKPSEVDRDPYLILSTQGGLRAADGTPVALGYHTGHWEVGLLVQEAAEELKGLGVAPFAAMVSDPCDGRTQGTPGMMDSLPYRNDAAIVFRRLIRSLPRRRGILGVATCDKGLPAMLLALAGSKNLPGILVPGGVTLPPSHGEDAGKIQSIGARYSHQEISLKDAAEMGCRACATAGGGCQFLGTAATAQVVAEALGLSVPHAALAPSGQAIWRDVARRSARAVVELANQGLTTADILTPASIRNAMTVHAAFGGSTNLLLHVPAIAFAAGLPRPTVDDWAEVNRRTPRLVDVLPNGPSYHPTIRAYLAGGVPEVMLHLRKMGLLDLSARSVMGCSLGQILDEWSTSDRRMKVRQRLIDEDHVDPDDVIMNPERAHERGLTRTVTFPRGNLAPEGSVIKSTAIDPTVVDPDGVYRKTGPARVFTRETDAIAAIKGQGPHPLKSGDILVLIGRGPLGTGMEEIYQITSALKHLSFGKEIAVVTDARFSGVSTGACIGHVGPEALAGGPIGKVRDGDRIEIIINRVTLEGAVNLIGTIDQALTPDAAVTLLRDREPNPALAPDPDLPADTRLWAALQSLGGGTWGGCVYDPDAILAAIDAGRAAVTPKSDLPVIEEQDPSGEPASMTLVDVMALAAGVAVGLAASRPYGMDMSSLSGTPLVLTILAFAGFWVATCALSFVAIGRTVVYRRMPRPAEWLAIHLCAYVWGGLQMMRVLHMVAMLQGPAWFLGLMKDRWLTAFLGFALILALLGLVRLLRGVAPPWIRSLLLIGATIAAFTGPIPVLGEKGAGAIMPADGVSPSSPFFILRCWSMVLIATLPLGLMIGVPFVATVGRIMRRRRRGWGERAGAIVSFILLGFLLTFAFFFYQHGLRPLETTWLVEKGLQVAWAGLVLVLSWLAVDRFAEGWDRWLGPALPSDRSRRTDQTSEDRS